MVLWVSNVEAAPVTLFVSGNDCGNHKCVADETGTFEGTPEDGSPFIIKFNADGSVAEINLDLYPSITGDEFDFTPDLDNELGFGSWTYTAGAGDPFIKFWTGKGGPNYNLFYEADGSGNAVAVFSGDWSTPINPANDRPFGLSHISFYNTGDITDVPEPMTLLLFGTAATAAAWRSRRRKLN